MTENSRRKLYCKTGSTGECQNVWTNCTSTEATFSSISLWFHGGDRKAEEDGEAMSKKASEGER